MEQFLQNINPIQAALLLGGLCVVGIVLLIILNLFGLVAGLISNVIELSVSLLSGDPTGGCGCGLALAALGICACIAIFGVSVLSTCGTERAVNFCALFGR